MIRKQLFQNQVSNNSLLSNKRVGTKYCREFKLDCKSPTDPNFFKLYVKIMKSIKIENMSKHHKRLLEKLMRFSLRGSRSTTKFTVSSRDFINFNIGHFAGLEKIEIDLDIRRNLKNIPNAQIQRLLSDITMSPKLNSLKLSPFSWKNFLRLRNYRKLEHKNLSSSLADYMEDSDAFERPLNAKNKITNSDYALELHVDSQEKIPKFELYRSIQPRLKSLTIKNNGNSNIDVLLQNEDLHTNLLSFSYMEQGHSILKKPELLTQFAKFLKLKRLEVEFWVGPNEKSTVFDSFLLPNNLRDLKLTFSNCRFTMLEETKISQPFFTRLNEIKTLSSFEFDAFRLSLLKEPRDTCIVFLKNVMKCLNNDITTLRMRGPPAKEIDDEFYELLLKFRRLSVLDIGLNVEGSDEVLKKFQDYRGHFKNLSLHSNFSFFLNLPKYSLKQVEELTLYFGICIPSKGSMKSTFDLIRILDKVKNLNSLKKLTVFYSLSVEDSEIKSKLLSKISEVVESLKQAESISVTMRAVEAKKEMKDKMENILMWKKAVKAASLKFQNMEISKQNCF